MIGFSHQTYVKKLFQSCHQEVNNKSSSRCQAVVSQLSVSCQSVVSQLSVSCRSVVRMLPSIVVRKSSVSHQVVIRQSSGSHQAAVKQMSSRCHFFSFFEFLWDKTHIGRLLETYGYYASGFKCDLAKTMALLYQACLHCLHCRLLRPWW